MRVRKAVEQDAGAILELVNSLSGDGTLLRRDYSEICGLIDTFAVAETDAAEFMGCAALYGYSPRLAEVRSIVVRRAFRGCGAGAALMKSILREADGHEIDCVCLFTRRPDFFRHFNFGVVQAKDIPEKYEKDCRSCPRRAACDEVAMVRGNYAAGIDLRLSGVRYPVQKPVVQLGAL